MKGGQTPIHIMRWAPADYVNDPFVRRLYQREDYRTLAFYSAFLFYSHVEGGDLPADVQELSAIVLMPSQNVRPALRICVRAGKIQEHGGRLFHKRVKREVVDELEYRREQAELGKKGGRPKRVHKEEGEPKGTLSENESPSSSASSSASSSSSSSASAPAPIVVYAPEATSTGDDDSAASAAYVSKVLELYGQLPDTRDQPTRADRKTARELFRKGIQIETVRAGLITATSRRVSRTREQPLSPVGSLSYFLDAIEEARDNPPEDGYIGYLEGKIKATAQAAKGTETHDDVA